MIELIQIARDQFSVNIVFAFLTKTLTGFLQARSGGNCFVATLDLALYFQTTDPKLWLPWREILPFPSKTSVSRSLFTTTDFL
jgi:hypothetical protein